MYNQEQIDKLIKEKSGLDKFNPNDDLFFDLRISGDDFHELMEEFATTFKVDMSNYLWYFHTNEEGQNIGGVFFKPPYNRVNHIPVTPAMLLDFANAGHWQIQYPEHQLPKYRWDMVISYVVFAIFLGFLLYSCL